ncbi:hypothetical protein [Citrobacter sp. S-77]|uniref:hypothetical protein n=1 Tax=Citrobacter sp. S-77 TaxID=1080067 RepID=UPI000AEDF017|nr:hypothetical protein [Citrobacter sp. S-77]
MSSTGRIVAGAYDFTLGRGQDENSGNSRLHLIFMALCLNAAVREKRLILLIQVLK